MLMNDQTLIYKLQIEGFFITYCNDTVAQILQLQNGGLQIAEIGHYDEDIGEGREDQSVTCTGCMYCKFLPCSIAAIC